MPLDFPSNPVDGQVYSNYIWSASSGVWKSIPSIRPTSTVSSTAPSSASSGDIWIDSNDGNSYYYYDDGTSKQWVEFVSSGIPSTPVSITSGGTGASTLATAQSALQIQLSPNYLINGNFDFWQRGTSFTVTASALAYTADRWYCVADGTTTVSQISAGQLQGSKYSLRIARSTATPGSHNINQLIETENVRPMMGKTVTFSINLRRSSGIAYPVTLYVYKSSTVDAANSASWTSLGSTSVSVSSIPTGTTSIDWYRASVTVTVPNDGTANTLMVSAGTYNINSGDYIEVSQAQIEVGSLVSSFRRNSSSQQAELAACQRYYEKSYDIETTPGTATSTGSLYVTGSSDIYSNMTVNIQFASTKRRQPSISFWNNGGVSGSWTYLRSGVGATNTSMIADTNSWIGKSHSMVYGGVGAVFVASTIYGHFVADAEL